MTNKNILLQHVDNAEADLYYARKKLADAQKALSEYQEPTMAQDTLCDISTIGLIPCPRYFSHVKQGRHFFFDDGATSKTAGPGRTMSNKFKIIEEPGLPWKDIDDNVPKAKKYLVESNEGTFYLCQDLYAVKTHIGQYLILQK